MITSEFHSKRRPTDEDGATGKKCGCGFTGGANFWCGKSRQGGFPMRRPHRRGGGLEMYPEFEDKLLTILLSNY